MVLLHADADSFFASVVLRRRPDLVPVPVAVSAHVFVASPNYPARARGVRGGMLVHEALRICPELVVIDVPRTEVEEASDALFDIFHQSAHTVEPGSMEEGFLDPGTSDVGAAVELARTIRRRAMVELGLPVSVGIGRTKLMAKLASRAAKPDGLYVIDAQREAELRSSLPVGDVWGIGAHTKERLRLIGVHRLHDLDRISPDELKRVCGTTMSSRLQRIREGTDEATLHPVEGRTSLSSEGSITGFARPDWTPTELVAACTLRVCRRAERAGLAAAGLSLTVKSEAVGPVIVLKHQAPDPTSDLNYWAAVSRDLLTQQTLPRVVGVRVTLTGLVPPNRIPPTLF
ncbi:DNA polymerase-4 [Glaciihabitans tibetensis]|uniref:DNA polymerase-4 n=2 Tax=Glaciihabitans tibetensis TaxID=1266600 RepID=A0A2T0VI36_9MICO|nr:DNA polymerase-4 [Glaciihabitans tibetensis]